LVEYKCYILAAAANSRSQPSALLVESLATLYVFSSCHRNTHPAKLARTLILAGSLVFGFSLNVPLLPPPIPFLQQLTRVQSIEDDSSGLFTSLGNKDVNRQAQKSRQKKKIGFGRQ
jgi:hypothetical protein